MQGNYTEKGKTFLAGEDLESYRRVKIETGTTTMPPEVVYADAGEDAIGVTLISAKDGESISVRLLADSGTVLIEASAAVTLNSDLYGTDDGKIDDAGTGTAVFRAIEAATASGDIIECAVHPYVSTTAATVSIADAGGFTTAATVEAATQEIYQHILSAQKFIPIPLTMLFEGDATNLVAALGPATTPILDMTNGDTDSALRVSWVADDVDEVVFQMPLPPDLDVASDLVLHFRSAASGATDTITVASDAYFNEADTKVEDSTTVSGTTYAEKTITIAAADIPAGAQTVTIELTPGAHANDALYITAMWFEYTGTILAS